NAQTVSCDIDAGKIAKSPFEMLRAPTLRAGGMIMRPGDATPGVSHHPRRVKEGAEQPRRLECARRRERARFWNSTICSAAGRDAAPVGMWARERNPSARKDAKG